MLFWLTVQFLGGLLLLLAGGDALVRGAAIIARNLGVPSVVVGLTVVAFGTSAPEFVIAVTGTATGAGGVAFGNLVGASIVNIAMILGVTAAIIPLTVHPTLVTREIPMLVLAVSAAWILSMDQALDGGVNRISRGDGLVLCLLFGVFLYYTAMELRKSRDDVFVAEARTVGRRSRARTIALPVGLVLIGLVGLGIGGNLVVGAAVDIAAAFGMSQAMIGMTIVAIGTTVPELTTSLLAARRNEADLAVGNIVGSNIFNMLFVLGVASTLNPIEVPERGPASLSIALGASLLLWILINTGDLCLKRREATVLLLGFAGYFAWAVSA